MESVNRILDILSKYQKYFLGLAIFLSLTSVSITVSNGQIDLNLRSYPLVMILLVAISIVMAIIYISIDKYKIKNLSNRIQETSADQNADFNLLILELTSRQKEVFELILSGKSNKEIMAKLFIEQSTLKSHINQVYKKLKIKDRKELKNKQQQEQLRP